MTQRGLLILERLPNEAKGLLEAVDWDALRGAAPDATGELSSEDFVRRKREEDWR